MYLKKINGDIIGEGESLIEIVNTNKANLYMANLSGANLSGVDLSGVDLYMANLSGVDLYGADLSGANLSGVNLSGADLSGANLSRANLYGADLSGVDRGKWKIECTPIMINGLTYFVKIFSHHMEIGCEHHSFKDWSNFSDREILKLDGKQALEFWNDNKWFLLSLCEKQEKRVKS